MVNTNKSISRSWNSKSRSWNIKSVTRIRIKTNRLMNRNLFKDKCRNRNKIKNRNINKSHIKRDSGKKNKSNS